MTDSPSLSELLEVQRHFALPSTVLVEKDWHVLRAISRVKTAPFRLVFAGGTCLARAHKLVRRMSEDVDFKVVLDGPPPASANKLRQELGALRDRISAGLQAGGFLMDPANTAHVRSLDANRYTVYHLTAGTADNVGSHLRPTLQIELNFARLRLPSVSLAVASFVCEAYGDPPEVPSMACADVTETAAEKIVSLTRRTAMELAGLTRTHDPTLVRHIYDLHAIRHHIDQQTVTDLVREIAAQDAVEFAGQHPAYGANIATETHRALDFLRGDPALSARYAGFVAAMVYGSPYPFAQAIETLTTSVNAAWPQGATSLPSPAAPLPGVPSAAPDNPS